MNRQKLIAARLRKARQDMGISQESLGKLYGCTGAAISQMERCVRSIGLEALDKLAPILNKSLDWFLEDQVQETTRHPEAALYDLQQSIKAYIPVYAQVSAGMKIDPIDYVASTRKEVPPDSYLAYRVKGLCLEPDIKDGDTVIVDIALTPQDKDLVICIINTEPSVKIFHRDKVGKTWLENKIGSRALHIKESAGKYIYRDEKSEEDIIIHGVVVEYSRKLR